MHLRGCLVEGGWAEGTVAGSLNTPQSLVLCSHQATATVEQCTLLWHGRTLAASDSPRSSSQTTQSQVPAAEGPTKAVRQQARGGQETGAAATEPRDPAPVSLVEVADQARVQLSCCELRAVDGPSQASFSVKGIRAHKSDSLQGGAVMASKCRLVGCGVNIGLLSTFLGVKLRLSAGSMGSREAGGTRFSAIFGVDVAHSSTCKLVQCRVDGYDIGLLVSDHGHE